MLFISGEQRVTLLEKKKSQRQSETQRAAKFFSSTLQNFFV